MAVGIASRQSAMAATSRWPLVATGALSCWAGGHGRAATTYVEQGWGVGRRSAEMRNEAQLAD